MSELRPFATAKQAADIGGITPTDIGVSATAFVRKSELVKTGKFDETNLAFYQSAWFVNLDAVKKASGGSILHIEWLPFSTVLASATETSTFVSCQGDYVGDPVVAITGALKNATVRIEKYTDSSGWTHRIYVIFSANTTSEELVSTVTVTITDADGKSITSSENVTQSAAVIDEFDVQPRTLSFTADGGDGVLTITAPNRNWVAVVDDEPDAPESLEVAPTSMSFGADPTSGKDVTITATGDWS